MTASLTGSSIFRQHDIAAKIDPLQLEPPYMLPELRTALEQQCRTELAAEIHKVVTTPAVQQSDCRQEMREHVRRVFNAAVNARSAVLPGGRRSEVLGQGLTQLLGADDQTGLMQLSKLRRCRLPSSLRSYGWSLKLMRPELLQRVIAVQDEQLKSQLTTNAASEGTEIQTSSSNLIQRMCR